RKVGKSSPVATPATATRLKSATTPVRIQPPTSDSWLSSLRREVKCGAPHLYRLTRSGAPSMGWCHCLRLRAGGRLPGVNRGGTMMRSRWGGLVVLVAAVAITSARSAAGAESMAVTQGQQLYTKYCASCHGPTGKGDGPKATSTTPKASDLTQI